MVLIPPFELQHDEIPSQLIVGTLREDPEDGPPRDVYLDSSLERTPQRVRLRLDDVLQLDDGRANQFVFPGQAGVFGAELKFIAAQFFLVS